MLEGEGLRVLAEYFRASPSRQGRDGILIKILYVRSMLVWKVLETEQHGKSRLFKPSTTFDFKSGAGES